ncbi:helix-turn-helix transcriptional regulator [Croceimicrobium hydrocarbonivorans]|uniref:YafY family transcriptional regulator n=1 Tax=Croceimicrobium hydrocarbonivorans TaxID=2761580 RepID=A0A7H0VH35_9FLAO|nr:YafY family protein [Croceimicrobium hydrocarbonivorans]QNR25033.1 YafY family transcriptional regulator [Croceimicrobium hydrocarbonivorans]
MNRIDRLMGVLTTLQSKRYVSLDHLANKYEVSTRTVYRDLKALGEIGVPIDFDDQKGYSILQGFFLPPVSLSTEEANAIILVASLSERFTDSGTQKHIENALNKIKAVLRSSERLKIDQLQSQIRIYNRSEEQLPSGYLSPIQKAISEKEILQIEYCNNKGEISQREIEAIGLTFYSNQWHLIAWCWKRKEYRDFKVKQISKLSSQQEVFRKPEHYDMNDYLKSLH